MTTVCHCDLTGMQDGEPRELHIVEHVAIQSDEMSNSRQFNFHRSSLLNLKSVLYLHVRTKYQEKKGYRIDFMNLQCGRPAHHYTNYISRPFSVHSIVCCFPALSFSGYTTAKSIGGAMVVQATTTVSGSPGSPVLAVGSGAGDISVHSYRLSTVVPSSVTGEEVDYELTDADLLHKLHYLRAVHVFRAPAPGGALNIRELKEPMFPWLDLYFPVSGRLRRREAADSEGAKEEGAAGRPYVRCNDCGVRIVEATCDATVDEWMEAEAVRGGQCKVLAYDKVIGPELFFSPLLYIQVTSFKCGGMALGFTWAHLIGDIPSAATCFSTWAQILSGKKAPAPTLRDPLATPSPPPTPPVGVMAAPPSVKATAAPVGDHWAAPTTHDMVPFSFHVTEQQLKGLQLGAPRQVGTFELVAALTWRALAEIRGPEEDEATRTVTVVKTSGGGGRLGLTNEHRIGHVIATSPAAADVAKLAALLAGVSLDEAGAVAAAAAMADAADVVVYGANLTLVDAEGVDVYGLELGAWGPAHVEYAVEGVGDGGAVVVHRGGGRGRTVAGVVRRGEADRLRAALRDALRDA